MLKGFFFSVPFLRFVISEFQVSEVFVVSSVLVDRW